MDLIINISDKDDYKPLHQATVRQAYTPLTGRGGVHGKMSILSMNVVFINTVDCTAFCEAMKCDWIYYAE